MKKLRIIIPLMVVLISLATGCNSDDDKKLAEYVQTSNCAVTAFGIQANTMIASHLDSVFFSIDLDRGLIFNADSLPAGTDVSALITKISYPNTVKAAVITMTGGTKRTGQVDYAANPNDSIDFTGDVSLVLTAQDGVNFKEYKIKVNVHKLHADSLQWDRLAYDRLPSRFDRPKAQKTVTFGNKVYSFIRESDNSYTMSTTSSLIDSRWNKTAVNSGISFDIRSFSASDKGLYILDDNGALYESTDGVSWTATGDAWKTILGGYGDFVIGLRKSGNDYFHTRYPLDGFAETKIPQDFPIEGSAGMGVFSSKWALSPTGMIIGGKTADGKMVRGTWAFDGRNWMYISEETACALEDATLIPYYIYKKTSNVWITNEYSVWLLAGGRNEDGSLNRNVYVSYDNGVNWRLGEQPLQLPDYIPSMTSSDAVIFDTPMSASVLPGSWKATPVPRYPGLRMLPFELEDGEVSWNCPYIYLFGGYDAAGKLEATIWRGVLNRMTFRPLF